MSGADAGLSDWVSDPGGMRSVIDGDTGIVTQQRFPWGVRCFVCEEVIDYGSAYVSILFKEDIYIYCVACAATKTLEEV